MKDYEKLSREHFNGQAAVYDERNTVYYSREGKISCNDIASLLRSVSFEKLLDVGCGTGYLIDLLAREKQGGFYGLDLSEKMIEAAKNKKIPGAVFVVGTADHLPYGSESFDVVTCSQSFHHYPYQEKAMREAFRVLKRGGLYVLSDTGIGGVGAMIDNHILFKLTRSGDCRTQNRRSIAKMMKKTGFEVVDCRQVRGFIYTVVGKKP